MILNQKSGKEITQYPIKGEASQARRRQFFKPGSQRESTPLKPCIPLVIPSMFTTHRSVLLMNKQARNQLRATFDSELDEDISQMKLDGLIADGKPLTDLGVGHR